MNSSEQTLLDFLSDRCPGVLTQADDNGAAPEPLQLANLYVKSAILVTVMEFLKQQLWLDDKDYKSRGETNSYSNFISPFFQSDLSSLSFLKGFLIARGPKQISNIRKEAEAIVAQILSMVMRSSRADQKTFAVRTLQEMSVHFLEEETRQEGRLQSLGHKGPCLYRSFDSIDQIFKLDYLRDKHMIRDQDTKERLYQGSGVAVQSGYSTILLALHNTDIPPGSKIVDLGSGYGRVGLVFSLLRPDIEFTGYEYVPHRVEIANAACNSLDLESSLSFKVQDLSVPSFEVPDADIFYFYDPFSDETYRQILAKIVGISRRKKITIITKGNTRMWLTDIASENQWPDPLVIDEGNLCIFRST